MVTLNSNGNGKAREISPRYRKIADLITEQIHRGVLKAGDRSPSVRAICASFNVSASTAIEACSLLENRRLIEARPKSGFYVRARILDSLPTPAPSRPDKKPRLGGIPKILDALYHPKHEKKYVEFGAAVPSEDFFPLAKLSSIAASIVRRRASECIHYSMSPGLPELRRLLARRLLQIGCPLTPDNVIITSGCTEAISIALRTIAKPGDIVAVESPSYFGTLQAIQNYGLRVLEISTDPKNGMDIDALEGAIKRQKISAVVMVANFNNPLGSCLDDGKKRRLVSLLSRHRIPLVEDDIYGDIHFTPTRPTPAKAFDAEGIVLYCTSFSKTIAPGYRMGFIAPGKYYHEALQIKRELSLACSSEQQLVLAEFLKHGGYDAHLRKIRREYSSLIPKYTEAIAKYFPAGIRVTRPQGGFVLWIELPAGLDAIQLHEEALKHYITVAPGKLFSPRGEFNNFIRINCGNKWSPTIENSLKLLGTLSHKLAR